jgi:hypothetical protein
MATMLILRGKAGNYGGKEWPRGALDEPPALEYAQRRGYTGKVLDIAGVAVENSAQTRLALTEFRGDTDVSAIYGFSAGGYNVKHFLDSLTPVELRRLRLVVVLGAPENKPDKYDAHKYGGNWELVYRIDPPEGHMAGPKALLDSLP